MTAPLVWSILSFCLGTLFGHWLAIHRDRRKEFNDLADDLFVKLTAQGRGPIYYGDSPQDIEFELAQRRMGRFQRCRFSRALSHYREAHAKIQPKPDSFGEMIYEQSPHFENAVARLAGHLRRK